MKWFYIAAVAIIIGIWAYGFFAGKRELVDITVNTTTVKVEPIKNIGRVQMADSIAIEFSLINSGQNPFLINSVNPDCHCTVPKWEKQPVLPGDSTKIKIVYKPPTPGFFNKKVVVKSNNEEGDILLFFQGEVI